jgi:hypothetical protein
MKNAMPADQSPDEPAGVRSPSPDRDPVLPEQSREDTDAGWGERPELDDAERLYRERPPHWE